MATVPRVGSSDGAAVEVAGARDPSVRVGAAAAVVAAAEVVVAPKLNPVLGAAADVTAVAGVAKLSVGAVVAAVGAAVLATVEVAGAGKAKPELPRVEAMEVVDGATAAIGATDAVGAGADVFAPKLKPDNVLAPVAGAAAPRTVPLVGSVSDGAAVGGPNSDFCAVEVARLVNGDAPKDSAEVVAVEREGNNEKPLDALVVVGAVPAMEGNENVTLGVVVVAGGAPNEEKPDKGVGAGAAAGG